MSAVAETPDAAPMTMTAVAILVAQAHGLNLAELTEPTRDRRLRMVRYEAWRRLRTPGLAGPGRRYGFKEIGDFFGVSPATIAEAAPDWQELRPPPPPKACLPIPSRVIARYAPAFDQLFAQAFADGGFGALHQLIEEARTRLARSKRSELDAQGWIA